MSITDKLKFPRTEREDFDYDYELAADCNFFCKKISLAKGNQKLVMLIESPGIYGSYIINSFLIISEDQGLVVIPNDDNEPIENYNPDKFYQGGSFVHPKLESLLENQGYRADREFEREGGDYLFSKEALQNLTIKMFNKIISWDCVKEIYINLESNQ